MVVLSLRCCPGFSLVPASRSYSLAAVLGFRVLQFPWSGARAPGLSGSSSRSTWAQQLRLAGSRHGLTRSAARGIFQHRGSTPCLLHRQAHSLPLSRSEGATSRWWALSAQPSPRPTHSPVPARSQPPPTGAGSAGRAPPDGVRRGGGTWTCSPGDSPPTLQRPAWQAGECPPGLARVAECHARRPARLCPQHHFFVVGPR